MPDSGHTIFMRAARGEATERTPVWFMRQAGRSDPAYRALREAHPLPLEQLFREPDLAARISLLPLAWGVDAVIFFQDILTPLAGMGAFFHFRPGPVLESPEHVLGAPGGLHACDVASDMPFIQETFCLIRRQVGVDLPILGFAGAPLTLLCFLAEGGSPGPELAGTRALLREDPHRVRHILELLTDMTIAYLSYQFECGADAVQLFESAAQFFSREEYIELALPCQQRIVGALKGRGPAILFARLQDRHIGLKDLAAAGADVLSLPACFSIAEARATLGTSLVVQGNLDNQLLSDGSREAIALAASACLDEGAGRGHIFNLSHGLLPGTPHENVVFLVDHVREYSRGRWS